MPWRDRYVTEAMVTILLLYFLTKELDFANLYRHIFGKNALRLAEYLTTAVLVEWRVRINPLKATIIGRRN